MPRIKDDNEVPAAVEDLSEATAADEREQRIDRLATTYAMLSILAEKAIGHPTDWHILSAAKALVHKAELRTRYPSLYGEDGE